MLAQDWLLDAQRFKTHLNLLLDEKKWTDDNLTNLGHDPILTSFKSTQWCHNRDATIDHPLTILTLYLNYQWGLLFNQNQASRPRVRLHMLLFFARFIWPAYRIWVLAEPPAPPTHRGAAEWLSTDKQLSIALAELGQPALDETFVGFAKFRLQTIDSATLSRWIAAGSRQFHRYLCNALGQGRGANIADSLEALTPNGISWGTINQQWEQQTRSSLPSARLSAGYQPLVPDHPAHHHSSINSLFWVLRAQEESKLIAIVDAQRSDTTSLLLSIWRVLVVETKRPILFLDPVIAQQVSTLPALADYWLARLPSASEINPKQLVTETLLSSSYILIDSFDRFPEVAQAAWLSTFPYVHQVILTCRTYDERLDNIGGQALYLSRDPISP